MIRATLGEGSHVTTAGTTLRSLALTATGALLLGLVSAVGSSGATQPEHLARPVPAATPSGAARTAPGTVPDQPPYREFIVKFRAGSLARTTTEARGRALDWLGASLGISLHAVRTLGTGATLVRAGRLLAAPGQRRLVATFQSRGDVVYAAPEEIGAPHVLNRATPSTHCSGTTATAAHASPTRGASAVVPAST